MFAITEVVKKWRQYLLGRRFTIQTDHKSLRPLLHQTIQSPEPRWLYKLIGYDFHIEYKLGVLIGPADALSRIHRAFCHALFSESRPQPELWDAICQVYASHLDTVNLSAICQVQRTLASISNIFFWPELRRTISEYVSKCTVCQTTKPFNRAPQGLLQPLPIPGKIWHSISMDFITGLPPSNGKMTIMVVVDRLSKHAHFLALGSSFTAPQVVEIMVRDVIKLHGVPAQIVSDRDPVFISSFLLELFCLQGTMLATNSAYHSQTDGQTEVLNRYLEDYLKCFTGDNPRHWLRYLPWAEWHYNTAWHSAIKMSPFEAVFCRSPTRSTKDAEPGQLGPD